MENQNGEIHIYFHDGDGSGVEESGHRSSGSSNSSSIDTPEKNDTAKSALAAAAIQAGKQLINSGVNLYSNLTGNYLGVSRLQEKINLFATGAMLINFPVGTVAAFTSMAISGITSAINTQNTNRDINVLYERSGNAVLDNSKGVNI